MNHLQSYLTSTDITKTDFSSYVSNINAETEKNVHTIIKQTPYITNTNTWLSQNYIKVSNKRDYNMKLYKYTKDTKFLSYAKRLNCKAHYIANIDKINFYANKIHLAGKDPKKYGI